MKVKDLIEKLNSLSFEEKEMEVIVYDSDSEFLLPVKGVRVWDADRTRENRFEPCANGDVKVLGIEP